MNFIKFLAPLLFILFAAWSIGKIGMFVICIIISWYIYKKISGFFNEKTSGDNLDGAWIVQQMLKFTTGAYDNNIDVVINTIDNISTNRKDDELT